MLYRDATADDVEIVAQLHTGSWRRTYRGMYSDEFLDGDLIGNRRAVWGERLGDPAKNQHVCLALEGDELAGFICVYGDKDPAFGSLIDNLHTSYAFRRRGIATELMRRAAEWLAMDYSDLGVYLWVLEANDNARRFYEAIGGKNAEVEERDLEGSATGRVCRYVWSRPSALSEL